MVAMHTENQTTNASAATTAQPQFTASKFEMDLIAKIVKRAQTLDSGYITIDAMMDIEATHCSGNPLDLAKLLEFDDFNFSHDVFGIRRTLNRHTGKLTCCFSPRCSI